MREEEMFVTVAALIASVLALRGLQRGIVGVRVRRLDVLDRALQSGNLDPQTKHLLVTELTRPGPMVRVLNAAGRGIAQFWSNGRLLVACGWVGVFIGAGIVLAGGYDAEETGFSLAVTSFGILTVPFALRELARIQGREPRQTA